MPRTPCLLLALIAATAWLGPAADADEHEYYEIRTYVLGDSGDEAALDRYLENAFIPALQRQGIGGVGVFAYPVEMQSGQAMPARVVVVIPFASLAKIDQVESALDQDQTYQAAAKDYLGRGVDQPAYQRISSELLVSMDCMKQMSVPDGTLDNDDRVYELRVYESKNERLGKLKVDMFNAGEVPIFLSSKIQPIFIGECLIGPQRPSLTYLTVYENDQARLKAWETFMNHPDWKVLSRDPKYANTVSRIDKLILTPKPYSAM